MPPAAFSVCTSYKTGGTGTAVIIIAAGGAYGQVTLVKMAHPTRTACFRVAMPTISIAFLNAMYLREIMPPRVISEARVTISTGMYGYESPSW